MWVVRFVNCVEVIFNVIGFDVGVIFFDKFWGVCEIFINIIVICVICEIVLLVCVIFFKEVIGVFGFVGVYFWFGILKDSVFVMLVVWLILWMMVIV